MDTDFILQRVMIIIPLILSLTVHEWAHAWSAHLLGDDTASRQGRLTLDPLVHIDPIGTLLLPIMGVPFGWAKPVPVNPARFTRKISMAKGLLVTAAAGPASNVLLAFVCTALLAVLFRTAPDWLVRNPAIFIFLRYGLLLNISLAVFNMLPIPPLDGSRVAEGLLPYRWRSVWERYARYSALVLLAVIVLPMFVPGMSPVGWIVSLADRALQAALM
jgi:Zn-dependent protease